MAKILLVTGRLAEAKIRDLGLSADVLVLPVSVAQFISPKLALDGIKKLDKKYDKIIFPGLTNFDVSLVEKEVNMPCFKGTRTPEDLPKILGRGVELSRTESADSLIEKGGLEEYGELVKKQERKKEQFRIGDLKIGQGFPPRIIAEIVDAPLLTPKEALKRAQYYIDSGADIIDVGAIAAEENAEKLHYIIKHLKKLEVPISIDSLNQKEINAGLSAGADLVLSLCSENMDGIGIKDASYVVIPDEKNSLEKNLKSAKEFGFQNLIADPILNPPFNIAKSISNYSGLKWPLMLGVANVIELIDADSIGMNALLAAMAVELDVSLLLTTENSPKTRNSVKELRRALELSYLAKNKSTLPKDLGFDLLVAKGKNSGLALPKPSGKIVRVPERMPHFSPDIKGHFNIFVDFEENSIIARHPQSRTTYVGPNAESLSKKIIEEGIVSNLEHAAYLGRELQKAEIFLRLGRGYIQDEDFKGL